MQEKAFLLILLLMAPALAGCTFNEPKRWDLEVPLGLILSPRAAPAIDDVSPAAELAVRELTASQAGVRFTLTQDPAPDSAIAAFDRLASQNVAAVIAAASPQEGAALAERAAAKKIPLLLVTPAIPQATATSHLLQLGLPPAEEGKAVADLVTAQSAVVFVLPHAFTPTLLTGFGTAYQGSILRTTNVTAGAQGAIISAARDACKLQPKAAVILTPPVEAGWIVRGLQEGGCRTDLQIVAGAGARQPDLVVEAGRDGRDRPYAAGIVGVEPQGSRLGEFRTFFQAEYGRNPGPYAAETYDAVLLATLAAFHAKGEPRAKPVHAAITAADIQANLLTVAEAPGIKIRNIGTAITAAKAGDDMDWVGYGHDVDFNDAKVPAGGTYRRWHVTPTGGIEVA